MTARACSRTPAATGPTPRLRLARLIDAIERGVSPTDVATRIAAVKAEIADLDRTLTELAKLEQADRGRNEGP
jgi:hypothetical protein